MEDPIITVNRSYEFFDEVVFCFEIPDKHFDVEIVAGTKENGGVRTFYTSSMILGHASEMWKEREVTANLTATKVGSEGVTKVVSNKLVLESPAEAVRYLIYKIHDKYLPYSVPIVGVDTVPAEAFIGAFVLSGGYWRCTGLTKEVFSIELDEATKKWCIARILYAIDRLREAGLTQYASGLVNAYLDRNRSGSLIPCTCPLRHGVPHTKITLDTAANVSEVIVETLQSKLTHLRYLAAQLACAYPQATPYAVGMLATIDPNDYEAYSTSKCDYRCNDSCRCGHLPGSAALWKNLIEHDTIQTSEGFQYAHPSIAEKLRFKITTFPDKDEINRLKERVEAGLEAHFKLLDGATNKDSIPKYAFKRDAVEAALGLWRLKPESPAPPPKKASTAKRSHRKRPKTDE
jgi:hypothetical protein